MVTLDCPGSAPIRSITLEGVGDFDNGSVFGSLGTLYLLIQEDQHGE